MTGFGCIGQVDGARARHSTSSRHDMARRPREPLPAMVSCSRTLLHLTKTYIVYLAYRTLGFVTGSLEGVLPLIQIRSQEFA